MPGLDGFETCRRIKAQPAWAHIPVIFMTGLSETSHIVAGFDAGGVDYVVKPVRAQEVLARLATHVRNARAARLAREAVDVGGIGVLVVDARGRVAWRSPQAQRWLAEFFPDADDAACPSGCSLQAMPTRRPSWSVRRPTAARCWRATSAPVGPGRDDVAAAPARRRRDARRRAWPPPR